MGPPAPRRRPLFSFPTLRIRLYWTHHGTSGGRTTRGRLSQKPYTIAAIGAGAALVVAIVVVRLAWPLLSFLPAPDESTHVASAVRARSIGYTVFEGRRQTIGHLETAPDGFVYVILRLRDLPPCRLDDWENVPRGTCYVRAGGENCRVQALFVDPGPPGADDREGTREHVLLAAVPEGVRTMTLHLEGLEPIEFLADRKIREDLDIDPRGRVRAP